MEKQKSGFMTQWRILVNESVVLIEPKTNFSSMDSLIIVTFDCAYSLVQVRFVVLRPNNNSNSVFILFYGVKP